MADEDSTHGDDAHGDAAHGDDAHGDGVVTTVAEDTTPTARDTTSPTVPSRRRGLAVAAAVLIVALVAVSVVLLVQVLGNRSSEALRTDAVDTARDYAVALSSFDFENLDANRDAIVAKSTPEFAGKYAEMVDALRQIVTDGQGKATATVTNAAAESVDDERATVLVFVDQQATNVVSPEGNTQKYRMVVTLVRDGDRWVVDNVETL